MSHSQRVCLSREMVERGGVVYSKLDCNLPATVTADPLSLRPPPPFILSFTSVPPLPLQSLFPPSLPYYFFLLRPVLMWQCGRPVTKMHGFHYVLSLLSLMVLNGYIATLLMARRTVTVSGYNRVIGLASAVKAPTLTCSFYIPLILVDMSFRLFKFGLLCSLHEIVNVTSLSALTSWKYWMSIQFSSFVIRI